MNLFTQGLKVVLASFLVCASLFASQAPGDAKNQKKQAIAEPKASIEEDFNFVIHGFPSRIDHESDGTFVTCLGTNGRCMVMDFDNGAAIVDPDGCNMGPTYIGLQKEDGNYWILYKQTPAYCIWELYELEQIQMQSMKVGTNSAKNNP